MPPWTISMLLWLVQWSMLALRGKPGSWRWPLGKIGTATKSSIELVHRTAIAACELGSWQMALALLQLYHHRYSTAGTAGTIATVSAMAAAAKATQWPLVLKLLEETGWRPGGDRVETGWWLLGFVVSVPEEGPRKNEDTHHEILRLN
eukprot:s699_g36.t1